LRSERDDTRERLVRDVAMVAGVVAALRALRERVPGWPLPDDGHRGRFEPGLERLYRRGRKAFRAAVAEQTDEALHELRKRTKDLRHAARMLESVDPKRLRKVARRAANLSDVIGADHDLVMLRKAVAEHASLLSPDEVSELLALVDRRRAALRRRALKRARRLYKRKAKRLRRSFAHVPS
jgi:CHAD domain-containing protein